MDLARSLYIDLDGKRLEVDGVVYEPTEMEFRLYAYLAFVRLHNPSAMVTIRQIRRLPGWGGSRAESIGVQISRHIEKMRSRIGRTLLAEQGRTTGPYRLVVEPERIKLPDSARLLGELRLRSAPEILSPAETARFYDYIENTWTGDALMHRGEIDNAYEAYKIALANGPKLHHALMTKLSIGRVLERQNQPIEALKVYEEILREADALEAFQESIVPRAYIQRGWMKHLAGNHKSAEDDFYTALALIGGEAAYGLLADAYAGLGFVCDAERREDEARGFFIQTLEFAVIQENYFEIQAAYFGLGKIHFNRGERIRVAMGRVTAEAKDEYILGRHWLQSCIGLCDYMKIGQDIPDAELLLGTVYLRLDEHGRALDIARKATRIARKIGAKWALRAADEISAAAYTAMGDKRQAEAARRRVKKNEPSTPSNA